MDTNPVALITGAAKRIGAQIAKTLHQAGFNVLIHYNQSADAAEKLTAELNQQRANSALSLSLDLLQTDKLPLLVEAAIEKWGRLDALVNNASSFYPTPMGEMSEENWQDLIGTNLKAPLFLAQAAATILQKHYGSIVNIVDIHAENSLLNYPIYSAAKAGLVTATKALAKELAPHVRVNGIAPGPILWPEDMSQEAQAKLIDKTLLKRQGSPQEMASAVRFLIMDATYTTGQILKVDGGRTIN